MPSGPARGVISGHLTARRDQKPVAGAVVSVRETGAKTTTGADGGFSFGNLPPGAYTLVYNTAGGQTGQSQVVLAPGAAARDDLVVEDPGTALEEVVVLAQRTPIAVARLAQQQAPNLVNIQTYQEIRKLPDISAAEAVRRVPGISLETDEGEGRYVNIRGLDADLNSTTFGGLRLPPTNNASPFGGYRAVTLDSIPIGLVGAITVTKSNLPDQDAEALGGTIEITPKTAPRGGEPFVQGNVGTGYESLRGTAITDLGITAGGHFGGPDGFFSTGPFSIVLTASYYEDRRGIDDLEPAYINDTTVAPYNAINDLQQRDYELNRKRHAYGVDLGYEPDANNRWYLRAFDTGYTERYKRQYLEIVPDGAVTTLPGGQLQDTLAAPGAIEKNFRDEDETSIDRIVVAGGQQQVRLEHHRLPRRLHPGNLSQALRLQFVLLPGPGLHDQRDDHLQPHRPRSPPGLYDRQRPLYGPDAFRSGQLRQQHRRQLRQGTVVRRQLRTSGQFVRLGRRRVQVRLQRAATAQTDGRSAVFVPQPAETFR